MLSKLSSKISMRGSGQSKRHRAIINTALSTDVMLPIEMVQCMLSISRVGLSRHPGSAEHWRWTCSMHSYLIQQVATQPRRCFQLTHTQTSKLNSRRCASGQ